LFKNITIIRLTYCSHIWTLFIPPPVGANQVYSDG